MMMVVRLMVMMMVLVLIMVIMKMVVVVRNYLSPIITMLSSLLSTDMTVAQLLWRTIYLYLDFGTVAKHISTLSHPCSSP